MTATTFTIAVFATLFAFAVIAVCAFVLLYRQLAKRGLLKGAHRQQPDVPPRDIGGAS